MGFMDELKKLARPYAEDDDDFEDDFDLEARPKARPRADRDTAARDLNSYSSTLDELGIGSKADTTTSSRRSGSESKIVNIRTGAQLQVVLVKPDRFDNVSDIAEHLRSSHAVVLNLEATNKDISRRLVDFLSGCAYALDGKIKKIAISTYLITPCNVEIVGDLLDELENSGVYL